jgi:undecaprenyl-diphosphatase
VEQAVSQLLHSQDNLHYLIYCLAFFTALLETILLVGLILPGSTILLFLGAYTASGHLEFIVLWIVVVIGAILGDSLNYFLGNRYGHYWIEKDWWFLKHKQIERSQLFFDAHGAKSIFLGRFILSMKEFIPFVAGSMKMKQQTFMFWNVLGAMGWGLGWLGVGYLFAKSLNITQLWLPSVGLMLLLIILFYLLLWGLQQLTIRYGQAVFNVVASLWHSLSVALIDNEAVRQLLNSYPRFFSLLKQRIDSTHFYGLTLTLLSLAFVYVLILFGGIVEDLVTTDQMVYLDKHIAQLVSVFRTPDVLQFFIWVTDLGNIYFVLPFTIVLSAALMLTGQGWLTVPLLTTLVGSTSFTLLGKFAFQRPRPIEAALLEQSYSFPSGHATFVMGVYGFLVYLLIRYTVTWKIRIRLFFAGMLFIGLIGLSRIILDVHYLSDILGGFFVGALWLIIAISMTEWLVFRGYINFKIPSTRKRRWLFSGFISLAMIYYLAFAIWYQPNISQAKTTSIIELNQPLLTYLNTNNLQYTHTLLGKQAQPLGIVIIAQSDTDLLTKIQQAGWLSASQFNWSQFWQQLLKPDSISNTSVAPVFWHGQINDFVFILPRQGITQAKTTTLRLWRTPYRIEGKPIYLGVTRDYDDTLWRVFHSVDADIDVSKAELLASLQFKDMAKNSCNLNFVKPMIGDYFLNDRFFTKGKSLLLNLLPDPINSQYFCPNTNVNT